jgi:hypothetical protein
MRTFQIVPIIAFLLCAASARADVLTSVASCGEQLTADTARLVADEKASPIDATLVAADQAKVNADTAACGAAAGLPMTSHKLTFSLGGAADVNAFAAVKGADGRYVLTPTGGGAGAMFDLGFDQATDAATKIAYELWHVAVVAMVNVLVQNGHSVGAAVFAALVGYQPALNAPVFGIGPSAIVPFDGSPALAGVTLTAGLAAKVGSVAIPGLQL